MNCSDFATMLETLRDASRPSPLRAELDSHARACAACAKLRAAEDRLQAALQDLRIANRAAALHSHAFDARVRRAVRQASLTDGASRPHAAAPRWFSWPVLTSALASAIAIGAIVTVSLRETEPTRVVAITADAGPIKTPTPVLFSNSRVEVVSRAAPASVAAPGPAPATVPGLVLVEWDL